MVTGPWLVSHWVPQITLRIWLVEFPFFETRSIQKGAFLGPTFDGFVASNATQVIV